MRYEDFQQLNLSQSSAIIVSTKSACICSGLHHRFLFTLLTRHTFLKDIYSLLEELISYFILLRNSPADRICSKIQA